MPCTGTGSLCAPTGDESFWVVGAATIARKYCTTEWGRMGEGVCVCIIGLEKRCSRQTERVLIQLFSWKSSLAAATNILFNSMIG